MKSPKQGDPIYGSPLNLASQCEMQSENIAPIKGMDRSVDGRVWDVRNGDPCKVFQPPNLFSVTLESAHFQRGRLGVGLCLLLPDPFGSGQPPGFLTGYLIACAVLCALIVAQLVVLLLLQ